MYVTSIFFLNACIPICWTLKTNPLVKSVSPLVNTPSLPVFKQVYTKSLCKLEGKLQKVIRNNTSSGILGSNFCIISYGKCSATVAAAKSTKDKTGPNLRKI